VIKDIYLALKTRVALRLRNLFGRWQSADDYHVMHKVGKLLSDTTFCSITCDFSRQQLLRERNVSTAPPAVSEDLLCFVQNL
jgi:hypothetical protein